MFADCGRPQVQRAIACLTPLAPFLTHFPSRSALAVSLCRLLSASRAASALDSYHNETNALMISISKITNGSMYARMPSSSESLPKNANRNETTAAASSICTHWYKNLLKYKIAGLCNISRVRLVACEAQLTAHPYTHKKI